MTKKILLTFATTAGDVTKEFPLNQPLHAVKRSVMAQAGLEADRADEFIVTQDGLELDEQRTLGELGLADGTILMIEPRALVKI